MSKYEPLWEYVKNNNKDEYKLSKCVTLLKDIGGNAYIPFFSGIGGNGVPTQYVMFSDYLIKRIYKIEDEVKKIVGFEFDHAFLTFKKELIDYGYEFKRLSLKERWVLIVKKK